MYHEYYVIELLGPGYDPKLPKDHVQQKTLKIIQLSK